FQDGEPALMAAEGGAQRMFLPVTAASLTTIAAFIPLMMIGGIMGNILFDIPLIIICVIIASLIESFFILPGHLKYSFSHMHNRWTNRSDNNEASNDVVDSEKIEKQKHSFRHSFDQKFNYFKNNNFRAFIKLSIKYRSITLALSFAIFVLSIAMLVGGRIGYSFFPSPESQTIYANVSFVSGTPRSKTEAYLKHMQEKLYETEKELGVNLIETAISIIGSSFSGGQSNKNGDQLGAIYLQLLDPDLRTIRNEQFIRLWKSKLKNMPGMESQTISTRKAGPPGTDISIRLQGAGNSQLKLAANELSEYLKAIKGVYAIDNDMPYGKEQLILKLKPEGKMIGLTTQYLANQLRLSFTGDIVQIFQNTDAHFSEEVEVRVLLDAKERDYEQGLHNLYISTLQKEFVPLSSVANWDYKQGFEVLRHAEGELAIEVQAEVDSTVNKTNIILEQMKKDILPELKQKYGLSFSLEGRSANEKDTMKDMQQGLIIGLILMYIILSFVFSSYGWPLIVMSIIPFGLVGAIAGHWIMNIDMTLLSLFGFFGLSGIVVNDSIILVTFYKYLLNKGMKSDEALVEASVRRLRAVLLTSLTTIAGLTPLLFETSLQAQFLVPMATSIAFGLMFSTLIVLCIVPVLLSYYTSFVNKLSSNSKLVPV
ncbi:MAG: efflux RND transporter permease subunit, partial [Gammaproteobacteria bacterium]|nr:efflux RND transporter permease subunit [Gammaproteobacteria bacterium]